MTREAASRFGGSRGSPGGGGAEQGHALKSMSGVLIKEWSAFVLKEVRARKKVEAQMLALREEMRGMLATVRGDIDVQREEWIGDAAYYGAHVREALEKSARQRQRAAEMARKTFGRRWTVSVFGRWRDVTVERRRRRVAANRAMGRIMHLRVASPFHSWIAKVRDSRRARRALSKMSERRASNRTARAWAAWSRAAVVGRRSRRHDGLVELLRRRAATKMRRRDVSRAFSGWTAKVSEVRRMRAVGTKIAERWMRSSMADFFFAWFQLSRGKCRRRGRLSALVLRVFERKRHAAFITWARAVKRVKRERHLVRIVGARLAKGTLRQSFAAWTAESGARASKRRRVRDFARRVFLRWSLSYTTRAFGRWREAARTTRVARAKANATLLRWRRRDVHAAFSEWAGTTLYRLAARDNAMLFAVRVARSSAHKAFRTWRDAVADFAHRRETLERMVTRWTTHRLASAFDGWVDASAATRVRRAKMRSLIWRVRFAAAGRAFRSWRRHVELVERARLVVGHATAPSTVRALSAAFRGWRFRRDETRRRRALAKKAAAKMRTLRTNAAFRAWRLSVRRKADKRALAGRVVSRMTRVTLASAWDRWDVAVDALRRERRALRRADCHARRRAEDRAERAAQAFLDRLRRAASFRRRAHRVVARIRASVCARAFAKWIFVVDARRRASARLAKGARRFARVLLSKTIRAWYFACDDWQRERAVFAKAARKLDVLRLRRWWREWRTVAGEGLAERASTRRAIRRWTEATTGAAWRQWTSHVDRERVKVRAARTHAAIKSAVARERTLRGSWTSWREHGAYYRRASALVSKAYAKTCRLQKQSVFDQWWDFVREVEARKETLKRCVTSKRLLTTWFLDWYWRAFEGDISSALGAITDSTEDVIDVVYGDGRGVDRGVFQQWQMLGSSLEAMTARPVEDARARRRRKVATRARVPRRRRTRRGFAHSRRRRRRANPGNTVRRVVRSIGVSVRVRCEHPARRRQFQKRRRVGPLPLETILRRHADDDRGRRRREADAEDESPRAFADGDDRAVLVERKRGRVRAPEPDGVVDRVRISKAVDARGDGHRRRHGRGRARESAVIETAARRDAREGREKEPNPARVEGRARERVVPLARAVLVLYAIDTRTHNRTLRNRYSRAHTQILRKPSGFSPSSLSPSQRDASRGGDDGRGASIAPSRGACLCDADDASGVPRLGALPSKRAPRRRRRNHPSSHPRRRRGGNRAGRLGDGSGDARGGGRE